MVKKYKTIYADPPWEFDDKLDDSRKKPYSTMTIDLLSKLLIRNLVDDNAHLYLWVPSAFLEVSFSVIRAWGFDYKIHIPWIKRTKTGKLWFGMGHYFRHCNELCLFATRNNFKLKTKNTRNLIDALKPNTHHSAKPGEMYDLIENNSYPPYLELFATKKRENWTSWGYEINKKDIKDEIINKSKLFDKKSLIRFIEG